MKILYAAMLYAAISTAQAHGVDTVSVLRVIDGDTIVTFDGVREQRVRLIGVECPEIRRDEKAKRNADRLGVSVDRVVDAGKRAKKFAESFCPPGTVVTMNYGDETLDMYGRTLAYVTLQNGRVLNEILVGNGAAMTTPMYHHRETGQYEELQRRAREGGRGFWGTIWSSEREIK